MLRLCQIAKVVQCVAPIDAVGGAIQAANINMAKYDHVSFICGFGNLAGNCIVTMNYATGTLIAGTAMSFNYYESTTHAALVSVVDTAAITSTAAYTVLAASDDNCCIVVEVDAQDVRTVVDAAAAAATNTYVGMRFGAPGAAALISCVAICRVARYQADPNFMPNPVAA